MTVILLQLLSVASFLPYQLIVDGGHVERVIGVRDGSGQCICSMEIAHTYFPARSVERLQSDYYNLTNYLQDQLNMIYNNQARLSTTKTNLTDLNVRVKYVKAFGTHVDLNFQRLISDIHTVVSLAHNISKNATTDATKEMISDLITKINTMHTVVTTMEKSDKNNIITAQREIMALRQKLQECEEAIALSSGTPAVSGPSSIGKCDHDGLLKVGNPQLVKLNWKGMKFKAGSWGKDFALGTKFKDYYWVFPMNQDERTLEKYRLYASFKKLLLYTPIREYTLNINSQTVCDGCGQGAGVVFFNGTFFYNCLDSRALCKADPFSMRISREDLEDPDPASFNNWFSYQGVKYQDIDLAGDEKGLWMIYATTMSNGKLVIKKIDPETLEVGTPWITSQTKDSLSNSFMICGVLYGTKRKNSTHDEIHYMYDTSNSRERNIQILIEKPLPTVQSLNYNPNDQKLYMFNDGYLVFYDVTFRAPTAKRDGELVVTEKHQDSAAEEQTGSREEQSSSVSDQQEDLTSGEGSRANDDENPSPLPVVRR
ncbi:olfactomedin isoform X1 [Pogona vitticeps]